VADIVVKCGSCGEEVTVSEFVDPEMAACFACGAKLDMPKSSPGRQRRPLSTIRRRREADIPPVEEPPAQPKVKKTKWRRAEPRQPQSPQAALAVMPAAASERGRKLRRKLQRKKERSVRQDLPSWLTFIILTAVLCVVRYGNVLSAADLENAVFVGQVGIVILYIVVVLDAFKDDIFQGLLCLIPFYAPYYLYFRSDSFYLRAIGGALVVAFGPDAFVSLHEITKSFVDWVDMRLSGDY
jgi:hypothetical protein